MKQKILIFFLLCTSYYGFAQKTGIPQKVKPSNGNIMVNDSLRPNSTRSTSNLTYSRFINKVKISNIALNRKILSQMSILDPETFGKIQNIVIEKTAG